MTRIIVTNDDGVHAPGILALAQAMRALGDVEVIAPTFNQSSGGHKKTLRQDILVERVDLADDTPAVSVGGSPADCIALAALGLTNWPPRIVVSGINNGANMGQDITYSGTVTAALEGAINGVPALAVSLDDRNGDNIEHYREAGRVAVVVARAILERGLPEFTVLNLNIPSPHMVEHVKGIRLTRQGMRIYQDELEIAEPHYRIVGEEPSGLVDEIGTDMWAVHNGFASLTPIHLDMTAHRFIADLGAWDITV